KKSKPGIAYLCCNYCAHSAGSCVRCEVNEELLALQVIDTLRKELLGPDRLEGVREQLREKLQERRSENNLERLQQQVNDQEARVVRYRKRLMEVSRECIPDAEAELEEAKKARKAAQDALEEAKKADPVQDLEAAIKAGSAALWRLEDALSTGSRS